MGRTNANRKSLEGLVVYGAPEKPALPSGPRLVKRGRGRPDKLTPQVQERIVQVIRAGNYAVVAAQVAGIHEDTYHLWMARGEGEGSGKYSDFFRAVKDAEASAEAEAVAQVRVAARQNWAAGMTWLERKFPSRWGRYDRTENNTELTIRIKREGDE